MTSKEKKEPYNKNYTMECYIFNSEKQNPHKKKQPNHPFICMSKRKIFFTHY